MFLYLLKANYGETRYDCAMAFVVTAVSENQARGIAASDPGDEGADYWRGPAVTCQYIGTALSTAESGIVLRDFNAG